MVTRSESKMNVVRPSLPDTAVVALRAVLPAAQVGAIAQRIEQSVESFSQRFPGIHVDLGVWVERFLALCAGDATAPPAEVLAAIHADDLCLAIACESGDREALAHLTKAVLPQALSGLTRFAKDGLTPEDVKSAVLEKLFAGGRLASYSGRGPLQGWLRVVATRIALNMRRARTSENERDQQLMQEVLGEPASPEHQLVRQDLKQVFQQAFSAALQALPDEERDALRMHLYEGLSIDDLARIFGVHRATAARWLTRARDTLHAQVSTHIRGAMDCSDAELQSVMQLMMSQVDLSVSRIMREVPERS
jgi:RNA polymerase sigma-70 factor (ECF subfamily)